MYIDMEMNGSYHGGSIIGGGGGGGGGMSHNSLFIHNMHFCCLIYNHFKLLNFCEIMMNSGGISFIETVRLIRVCILPCAGPSEGCPRPTDETGPCLWLSAPVVLVSAVPWFS